MARLIPCSGCRQHIASSERHCPFCDRPLRTTTAWPAWLLGLSLTGMSASLSACVVGSDEPNDTRASNGSNSQGNDSIDDDTDTWGEGATYAGPDPGSSSATTDVDYGTTIETTETDSWGEGATYAGPDDSSGTDHGTDTGSSTSGDTEGDTEAFNGDTTAGAEPTDAP